MIPTVLIPGLVCTAELFALQVGALWTRGPVTVATTLDGETMGDLAAAILADAPPRFALAGLSMGGYIALEIMRRAPDRVLRLALLDTSARPDTPEQTESRRAAIARTTAGEFEAVLGETAPRMLHPDHQTDATLIGAQVRMGLAVGAKAYVRQQSAIIAGSRFRRGSSSATRMQLRRRIGRKKWRPPSLGRGWRLSKAPAI